MRADDVLDQINHCLGDYDISPDAMRFAPNPPPEPDGRNASPRFLTVTVDTAATLVRLREVCAALEAFAEAFTPAAEAASRSLDQITEAMRKPVRPPGRPAWQTPHGPAPRRR